MKLLLTSAGITNKTIEKALKDLLVKPFNKSNLVFIPTAANVEEGGKEWLVEDMNNFLKLEFDQFEIADISALPRTIWEPRVTKADVIVFGGGNDFYLIDWVARSGLRELLPKLLKTKVYVGISAGSCVAGELSVEASRDIYEEDPRFLNESAGLEYINLIFLPHLNSQWFPKISKENVEKLAKVTNAPIYALDDESALKVEGENLEIVSEGQFLIFND